MTTLSPKMIRAIVRLSLIGFLLFVVFYLIAAVNYPGGSYSNYSQNGFSFVNNYLCDLLDDHAIDGSRATGEGGIEVLIAPLFQTLVFEAKGGTAPTVFDMREFIGDHHLRCSR